MYYICINIYIIMYCIYNVMYYIMCIHTYNTYIHTYINADLVSFLILTDRRQAKGVTGVPRGGDRIRLYM